MAALLENFFLGNSNKLGDPLGNTGHIVATPLEFIAPFKPFMGLRQDRQHEIRIAKDALCRRLKLTAYPVSSRCIKLTSPSGPERYKKWAWLLSKPSITTRLGLRNQRIEPIDKILFIGRIAKNVLWFDPPDDHVMQNPGRV